MFLKIIRSLRREDDGVAMAAVLGLLAVGLVLTSLILTSVVSAQGFSTVTRAGVQSQASAEAGIAAARAGLAAGTCSGSTPTYQSTEAPAYTATIWRPNGSGGWVQGCPLTATSAARIVSTGYAVAEGIAGASRGDETVLEAILAASAAPVTLAASGPAIYAYAASSYGGSGQLLSIDGSVPDVLVRTGNVACNGAAHGVANFVVNGGTLRVDGSCSIAGNAFSSGRMTFEGSGYVGGYVVANGITMTGSSRINGRAWSRADVVLSGSPIIQGILKAQSATLDGGTLNSSSYIYGNTNVQNAGATSLNATLTTQTATPTPPSWWGGNARISRVNPITAPTFASDVPATPVVPNWVEFGSRADDYTTAVWNGFAVYTMGSTCNTATIGTAIAAIGIAPGVIDGRNCAGGTISIGGSDVITVNNDLAIIADNIDLGGSMRFTSSTPKRMWLINPDKVANGVPTCPGKLEINGTAGFTNLSVMLYSPCRVLLASSTQMTGQIFAADVSLGGTARLQYRAVGLPGVNLSTGTIDPTGATSSSRPLVSLRNVEG